MEADNDQPKPGVSTEAGDWSKEPTERRLYNLQPSTVTNEDPTNQQTLGMLKTVDPGRWPNAWWVSDYGRGTLPEYVIAHLLPDVLGL